MPLYPFDAFRAKVSTAMDELLRVSALVGTIAGGGGAIAAGLLSIQWVLGPLDKAAKNRQAPLQFGLADMLCLFFLIQLPIGGIHWIARGEDPRAAIIPDIVVAAIVILVWWFCWRTMSKAGILVAWQRMLVLAIILPGGYVGSVALAVLPLVAAGFFWSNECVIAWSFVSVELILMIVLYIFGRISRVIVAANKKKDMAVDAILLPDEPTSARRSL
jgi:hypothetical protein